MMWGATAVGLGVWLMHIAPRLGVWCRAAVVASLHGTLLSVGGFCRGGIWKTLVASKASSTGTDGLPFMLLHRPSQVSLSTTLCACCCVGAITRHSQSLPLFLVCCCNCLQVSAGDSPELRLLRPLVLEAAGFLGYTQAMNTAGRRPRCRRGEQ
jgi:hypothetical protein